MPSGCVGQYKHPPQIQASESRKLDGRGRRWRSGVKGGVVATPCRMPSTSSRQAQKSREEVPRRVFLRPRAQFHCYHGKGSPVRR